MKKAYLFPGQGSQFKGMGKQHYRFDGDFKKRCDQADEILGYRITEIMFEGDEESLTQTKYTQPALFVHGYARFEMLGHRAEIVAGHSLGEYTALVAAGVLSFEDALVTVQQRAELMQKAGEESKGTMAAVIGLEESVIEEICNNLMKEEKGVVVPANYNATGQVVISGDEERVQTAIEKMKEAGAKMAKKLPVSGAFHSSLMKPAHEQLDLIIDKLSFHTPRAFVYSNYSGSGSDDPGVLKENLKRQMLNPVRWTRTIQTMHHDGVRHFIETGPGSVLQGLVKRTVKNVEISGFQ